MREIFKKSRGFGIIEAIIALAILGVALSAMMQSTTIMFNALKTDNNIIRDNTYCENIFNNLIVLSYIARSWLNVERRNSNR